MSKRLEELLGRRHHKRLTKEAPANLSQPLVLKPRPFQQRAAGHQVPAQHAKQHLQLGVHK